MYEFTVANRDNFNIERIIAGVDYRDACRRYGLNPVEWIVVFTEYVD